MLSIIYSYRNRDLKRVKRSFDSLSNQSNKNFEVFFNDYGSNPEIASDIKQLCLNYPFISYQFCPTQYQPWNKSRALNSVIKSLKTDFCFVADVDIIFHPDFVETAHKLMRKEQTTYFQVGYLSSSESHIELAFEEYSKYRLSSDEATGLSLFPVSQLKELNGFDEFYHFWGAEDTDMHVRLRNAGYKVKYYDKELLLLHQWHKSFQQVLKNDFLSDLNLSGVLTLNHQHLKNAIINKTTKVNLSGWGEIPARNDFEFIEKSEISINVTNEKRQVDDILYGQLPVKKEGVIKISFKPDPFEKSKKFKIKRILRKKVPEYYTLTEVKDMVLLHLISFYRNMPYAVKMNIDRGEIEVAVKFS